MNYNETLTGPSLANTLVYLESLFICLYETTTHMELFIFLLELCFNPWKTKVISTNAFFLGPQIPAKEPVYPKMISSHRFFLDLLYLHFTELEITVAQSKETCTSYQKTGQLKDP